MHESSCQFYPANSPKLTRMITRSFLAASSNYFASSALRSPCCYSLDQDKGSSVANTLDQYNRSTTMPLAASICNTKMVNADAAPALPWGASNERDNVQQADARHSRLSHSLTTAGSEPDHSGTPQVEEAWPSCGSTIEVHIQLYLWCATPTFWSAVVRSRKNHRLCVLSKHR